MLLYRWPFSCPPGLKNQRATWPSKLPVARYLPLGEKATLRTASVCPCMLATCSPVSASQTFAVLSQEPVAMYLPSGE